MKIENMKINGMHHPIGHCFDKILCSWTVSEAISKHQINVKVEVSKDTYFLDVIYRKEDSKLHCYETELELELEPYTTYFWRVTVTGEVGEEAVSDVARFETAKRREPWIAEWIGTSKEDIFHPVIRKSFNIEKVISRARIYICGLGVYEAYLNGEKIGNEYLAPFNNDYQKTLQYQTYDITKRLSKENKIDLYLGKGWYMGRFGLEGRSNNYGSRMAVIAELRLEYEDGSVEVIPTDEKWQYQGSDIEDSGIYDGEVFNRELWKGKENPFRAVNLIDLDKSRLSERYSMPLVVKEERKPVEILHTPAGECVLDMGQNFAGFIEFKADLWAGTKVVLDFGEVLQQGNFYHENYRSANKGFTYVSNGNAETVRPHFTYYGFRYVRVTGWPGEIRPEDFTGKVIYSDLTRTGYLETSNQKINRLYENCLWSQKSNFIDIPTDCPQRDERLGWTGDAQVFAPTACYNMDTRAFYRKFLHDLRSEQLRRKGAVPNYVPTLGADVGTSSVWGDVATFLPTQLYKTYGNLIEMKSYYPLMKDWVDYISGEDEKNGTKHLYLTGFHFGDWLAQDGVTAQSFKGGTEDGFISSVYYYRSATLLSEMAKCLTEGADNEEKNTYQADAVKYLNLAELIQQAIFREYFTPNGRLSIDTQAAYVIALHFGVYKQKDRILAQFKERLKKDCYEIKCGFVGAPLLCVVLCENGMEEMAYHFLFKEEFPSWLYCVNLGATTIWERWNSLLSDGTISGTGMNSFNHYAYGSVIEFMYAYVAGIRPLQPAFAKVTIAPMINMKFRYVMCTYESVSGKYVVNWSIGEDGRVSVHVEVPFDCEAEIRLPRYQEASMRLESGIYDFKYIPMADYRNIYSMDSRLEEFIRDEEAIAILREELPIAYGMLMGEDKENKNRCLGELMQLGYMGFTPGAVQKAVDRLLVLKRW